MRCSRFHWTGFPDARLLCYYNTNTAAVSAIIQTNLSKAKPLEERIYAQAFKTQDDLYSGHHENSYPPLFETYLSFYTHSLCGSPTFPYITHATTLLWWPFCTNSSVESLY